MKSKILSSFLAAVTLSMCCLPTTVNAENWSPSAPVSVVEQRLNYSSQTDISTLSFSKIDNQEFTGGTQTPSIIIKDGSVELKKNTDYKCKYENNTQVGTATLTITGIGNYCGTKTVSFKIVPRAPHINAIRTETSVSIIWSESNGAENISYIILRTAANLKSLKPRLKQLAPRKNSALTAICVLR